MPQAVYHKACNDHKHSKFTQRWIFPPHKALPHIVSFLTRGCTELLTLLAGGPGTFTREPLLQHRSQIKSTQSSGLTTEFKWPR